MILGGPALYLLGESLFRWRMTGVPKAPRLAVAALLLLLAPLGGHVEALPLSIVVAALLSALAVWELRSAGLSGQTGKVLQTRRFMVSASLGWRPGGRGSNPPSSTPNRLHARRSCASSRTVADLALAWTSSDSTRGDRCSSTNAAGQRFQPTRTSLLIGRLGIARREGRSCATVLSR